jgi:glycerol-3-phosphate dehydrogenase (NAD(P)+)
MLERAFVIGDGGWGTALALVLDERGVGVSLWCHDADYGAEMRRTRRNPRYLPGIEIPDRIAVTTDASGARDASTLFSVVPSQYLRGVLETFRPYRRPEHLVVSATKGIEHETMQRPSEILHEVLGDVPLVVVSGPSHAEEVARRMPTTVVSASTDHGLALRVQDLLTTDRFRVYSSSDPLGVELAGAVKNVLAIAGGIVDGLGLGDNSKAALLTRGIVEMARLGVALGANRETFFGLAGIGDLITSCISPHGRNRAVGQRIGRGESVGDILASMRQVAEGVKTAEAVRKLAERHNIEMPICTEVYRTLYEGKDAASAVRDLMTRQVKEEHQW